MPVKKFKTFEDAERDLWNFAPDSKYYRQLRGFYTFAERLISRRVVRGITRIQWAKQGEARPFARDEQIAVEKTVRKYHLKDPAQDTEDMAFWLTRSHEEKISVVENLRQIWMKMNSHDDADIARFRRVLRIIKQA